jgi:hypothetical protein
VRPVCALGPQTEQGKQFGQFDQSFSLLSFCLLKRNSVVLSIQQFTEPGVDGRRQPELSQFIGQL